MTESYLITRGEEMKLIFAVDDFLREENKAFDKLFHIDDNEVHVMVREGTFFPKEVYIVRTGSHNHYEVLQSIDDAMWLEGADLQGYDVSLEDTNLFNCDFPEEIKHIIGLHIDEYKYGTFAIVSNIRYIH